MRRPIPLFALPLLLSLPLVVGTAHADEDDYDDDNSSSSSYRQKPELGIALEASRAATTIGFGPGTSGGYLGMHARLGRRIGLGFGIEQAYGDDPSGWKRYDIAWNLPKVYMYLNPKSKTQLYVTTGMDMRVSHFDDAPNKPLPSGTPWGFMYFGTFLGGGVEHRLDKSMAFRFELDWFVRGRASSKAPNDPPLDKELNDSTRGIKGAKVSIGLVFF